MDGGPVLVDWESYALNILAERLGGETATGMASLSSPRHLG